MKYLILGGAGFIGQHLAHKLLGARHNRVVVIDNLSTANHNLEDFAEYKNLYEFHNTNIQDMDDKELLKLIRKADIVYHLAGSVGVENVDKHPKETLYNNVALINKLIPLFEKAKTHVVFASTSEIYGNGPFHEDDNAVIGSSSKLRWGYATSKYLMEFMLAASGTPYNIVRFFNVVGPGQLGDYGMVLPKFINAALNDEMLLVHGDGKQVRSFCHIDDALEMLTRVHNCPGETFNIGNDENATTIQNLAERVTALIGRGYVKGIPYEEVFSEEFGDIQYRVPVINKAIDMLGYRPQKSLDNIIEDML